jgi:O-6-methylguanine DNA methyltransferase
VTRTRGTELPVALAGPLRAGGATWHAAFTERGLCRLAFPGAAWIPGARAARTGPELEGLARQLDAYLRGELQAFDVPLDLRGTPFQRRVWAEVAAIPRGEVRTYAQVAATIGTPAAARAVGAANGANPVPIVVPCHRLVGSGGDLRGYRGGLEWKRRLLALEAGAPGRGLEGSRPG